jgi:hypothetical protein
MVALRAMNQEKVKTDPHGTEAEQRRTDVHATGTCLPNCLVNSYQIPAYWWKTD